jgi:hypothetical protein
MNEKDGRTSVFHPHRLLAADFAHPRLQGDSASLSFSPCGRRLRLSAARDASNWGDDDGPRLIHHPKETAIGGLKPYLWRPSVSPRAHRRGGVDGLRRFDQCEGSAAVCYWPSSLGPG